MAVCHWVRTNRITMRATTHAESLLVCCEPFIFIINNYFFEGIKSLLQRLPILSIPSLQPNCIFGGTKHCDHKLWRRPWAKSKLREIVSVHKIRIYPMNVLHSLNRFGGFIWDKVADKQAFALRLNKLVVAISTTGCSSTSTTDSWVLIADKRVATWTLCIFKIKECSVTSIELLIKFITRCLHTIENIKTPVDGVVIIAMVMWAYVAHSHLASVTVFQRLYKWEFVLVMQLASREIRGTRCLKTLCCLFGWFCLSQIFEKTLSKFLHF